MVGLPSLLAMAAAAATPRILIFSRTLGYRHDSIPDAITALKGHTSDLAWDATEDPTQFTSSNLANYDAVLFLMTTDSDDKPRKEILDEDQKTAFQGYLAAGGNFIGIHSSSDSLTSTPWYGKETGAYFAGHPPLTTATIVVLNASNPSTRSLPQRWAVQDEIYDFKSDPRDVGATVYLSVDESTYTDNNPSKTQGDPHPICWGQERGAGAFVGASPDRDTVGRSWYTSLGHRPEAWTDPTFMSHIMGGIEWALASNTTRAFNPKATVGNLGNQTAAPPPPSSLSSSTTSAGTSLASQSATSSGASPSKTSSGGSRRLSQPWRVDL